MQQGAKPDQAAKKAARAVRLNEEHIAEAGLAVAPHQYDGARAPPAVRLLDKAEVLAITAVSFPTIWKWMRAGTFPRSRAVGGKSMWLSSEIDQWLAALPLRKLKGDAA
jgi:predicted DNA-binding transcriptional regulator AlpA